LRGQLDGTPTFALLVRLRRRRSAQADKVHGG
jgi:hypothetical protein